MTADLSRDELAVRLEHAEQALTGSSEGCRLWFLDCAELTAKHRARADAAEARWQAVKDYLGGCILADEAVRAGMVADGETEKSAPFGGLVSANRSTLKKMRELEQS
jgi:hypothetical protein